MSLKLKLIYLLPLCVFEVKHYFDFSLILHLLINLTYACSLKLCNNLCVSFKVGYTPVVAQGEALLQ